MRDDVGVGTVVVVLAVGVEAFCLRGLKGRVCPFALRFEEESEGVGADVDAVEGRVLDS